MGLQDAGVGQSASVPSVTGGYRRSASGHPGTPRLACARLCLHPPRSVSDKRRPLPVQYLAKPEPFSGPRGLSGGKLVGRGRRDRPLGLEVVGLEAADRVAVDHRQRRSRTTAPQNAGRKAQGRTDPGSPSITLRAGHRRESIGCQRLIRDGFRAHRDAPVGGVLVTRTVGPTGVGVGLPPHGEADKPRVGPWTRIVQVG